MIKFFLKDIEDDYVRENFRQLAEYLQNDVLRRGEWKFFELTFAAGVTNYRHRHGLGFKPKDVILTAVSNSEAAIFNYDEFSSEFLDITTSGACSIRFFAGSYRENMQ